MSIVGTLILLAALGQAPRTALDVEGHVIEARRAIKSGRATIVATQTLTEAALQRLDAAAARNAPADSRSYLILFKNEMRRVELGDSVMVLDQENYLWHATVSHGQNLAVDVRPRKEGLKRVLDLRVCGIYPTYFTGLQNFSLSDCLQRADRTADEVSLVKAADGRKLTLVSIALSNNRNIKYWIDPARGWNVARVEVKALGPGGKDDVLDELDCQIRDFGGVWFPEKVTFTRSLNGVALVNEVSVISDAEFNIELPDTEFSLAAMRLPIGTYIHEIPSTPGPPRFWNGKEATAGEKPGK